MSRKRRTGRGENFLDEAELRLILNLPEAEDDDLDGADVSVDLGEEDELDVDVDVDVEEDEEVEDVDFEDIDVVDEWFVIDDDLLAEADGDDDVDEGRVEVDVDELDEEEEVHVDVEGEADYVDVDVREDTSPYLDDDTVLEISESMLKRELRRMANLNESPRTNSSRAQTARSAQNSGQVRELQHAVKELRGQLSESNLFNAKLLYANKLLQQEGLTDKQKVALVESLDEARSLREVRLIYKSLVSKTSKKSKTKRIGESAQSRQVLGSASRTTRSGASSERDAQITEAKRWAVLAGITD